MSGVLNAMPFCKVLDWFQQNSYNWKNDPHPVYVKKYIVTGFELMKLGIYT